MDLPAALSPPRFPPFSSPRSPLCLFLFFFFLALRLAASLFPASDSGEDSSVRAQPLAYNETENLRGTRGMRRMITYIETKNRPTRRSAARSPFLSLSACLFSKTPRHFHLSKRARIEFRDPTTATFRKRSAHPLKITMNLVFWNIKFIISIAALTFTKDLVNYEK